MSDYKNRRELVYLLHRRATSGYYCSLLGPRGRGKTTILKRVRNLISEQTDFHIPIWIDLNSIKADTKSGYLNTILETIYEKCGQKYCKLKTLSSDILCSSLKNILDKIDKNIVLLIDHVDAVPYDVARDLLSALRVLHDKSIKISVLTAGSVNLLYLTSGTLSPFNIAEQFFLKPLSFMEMIDLPNHLINEIIKTNPEYSQIIPSKNFLSDISKKTIDFLNDNELHNLFNLTKGEPCLIKRLVRNIFKQFWSGKKNVTIHNAQKEVIQNWQDDKLLKLIVDEFHKNSSWLYLIAELISDRDAVFTGVSRREFKSPDMCLALTREEYNKYKFANSFWEDLLKSYFTPKRLADSYVLLGKWNDAIKWYQKTATHRGWFEEKNYTLEDLVANVFEAQEPTQGTDEIKLNTVKIAYHLLGVNHACLLEKTEIQNGGSKFKKVCCQPSCSESCLVPRDLCYELPQRVFETNESFDANDKKILTWPIRERRGTLRWVICVGNKQYSLSNKQKKALNLLAKHFAISIAEAEGIEKREHRIARQKDQLQMFEEVNRAIQQSLDVDKTAEAILKQLSKFGFPDAMISFWDKQKNQVVAKKATGIFKHLVEGTVRDIYGGDILAIIIREANKFKDGEFIPNSFDDDRCAQDAIRFVDVRSQFVFPLTAKNIGWKDSDAFGTLQIGNISQPDPNSFEEEILIMIVRAASVALANALLHKEVSELSTIQEDQLNALIDTSSAITLRVGLDVLINKMLEITLEHINADQAAILIKDPNINKLVYRAVKGDLWQKIKKISFECDIDANSTVGWVVLTEKPVINPDISKTNHYKNDFKSIKSNCAVPIPIEGKIEGALLVESKKLGNFNSDNLLLLKSIAHIMGNVVAEKRFLLKAEALSEILAIMAEETTLRKRLAKSAVLIKNLLSAIDCSIFVQPEEVENQFFLEATTSNFLDKKIGEASYYSGEGLTGYIAQTGKSLRLTGEFSKGSLKKTVPSLKNYDHKLIWARKHMEIDIKDYKGFIFLGVPLVTEESCYGTIRCIFTNKPIERFFHEDQEVLELIGQQIALAIKRDRLEKSKDRMLAEAAHQVESPMHGAVQCIDILNKFELTKEEHSKFLTKAFENLKSCIDLVDRIVIFNRLDLGFELHKELVNISEIILNVIENRWWLAKERKLHFRKLFNQNIKIQADHEMITQVIENLISNALNHAVKNSVITVKAQKINKSIEIKIFNKGAKLSPENLEKCFEPSYSTTSPRKGRKGLGLGLSIARKIARLHSGDIKSANTDTGVVFTIILPTEGNYEQKNITHR